MPVRALCLLASVALLITCHGFGRGPVPARSLPVTAIAPESPRNELWPLADAGDVVWEHAIPGDTEILLVIGALAPASTEVEVTLSLRPARHSSVEPAGQSPISGGTPNVRRVTADGAPVATRESKPLRSVTPRSGGATALASPPPTQRRFHVPGPRSSPVHVAGEGALVWGRLAAVTERVAVYQDAQEPDSPDRRDRADRLAQLVEARVLTPVAELLGAIDDVDADGRLTLLLTPLLEQIPAGPTPLRAFVRSADLETEAELPGSNQADLIYLNSTRLDEPGLWPVLIHEAAHLAVFSLRRSASGRLRDEEWLEEGLAHAAEVSLTGDWTNLAGRVEQFCAAPERAPLVIDADADPKTWREPGSRGATALFVDSLRRRYGAAVLPALARGEVLGVAQCELATGRPFEQLFREWSVDLHQPPGPSNTAVQPAGETLSQLRQPRPVVWNPAHGVLRQTLRGTTARGVRLRTPQGVARWTLCVQSPRASLVQVSQLPVDSKREIHLTAAP